MKYKKCKQKNQDKRKKETRLKEREKNVARNKDE